MTAKKPRRRRILALLVTALGCAGATPSPETEPQNPPAWITRGGGAFVVEGQRVFFGVGRMDDVKNEKLGLVAAGNRARAEVAKAIAAFAHGLIKQVRGPNAHTPTPYELSYADPPEISISNSASRSAVIESQWTSVDGRSYYALARVDLAAVLEKMSAERSFDPAVREQLRAQAPTLFDAVAK